MIKLREYKINPALIVIDVQNALASKGSYYDLLGLDTSLTEPSLRRFGG